ncbi:MAG: DUF4044 domain-containing protein [Lactobacillus sp.]|nr:DUF4044 domain-containing protein [Lactobacillus sp.]
MARKKHRSKFKIMQMIVLGLMAFVTLAAIVVGILPYL